MATRIRALTTFRNDRELPNGTIRQGQTAVVRDRYAEGVIDDGYAVEVEEEVEAWRDEDLPEDTPQIEKLNEAGIHTLGGLDVALDNGEVGEITGIGPAREDQIESFLRDQIE